MRKSAFFIIGAVAAGVLLRFALVTAYRFDGLYGQDPYAYLDYAQRVFRLVTQGQPLGKLYYPLGYPIIGSLGSALSGPSTAGPLLVTMLCASVCCMLCALLAAEVASQMGWSDRFTWVIGLFVWMTMTLSPQTLQSSIVIMSDMPALMWAMLAAWCIVRYMRLSRAVSLVLAGLALGFATMTRWQYALLAVPFGIALLTHWRLRSRWKALAFLIVGGIIGYAPQLLMTLLDPSLISSNEITWRASNIFAQEFTTGDGLIRYTQTNFAYQWGLLTGPYFTALILLPFAIIGVIRLVRISLAPLCILLVGWFVLQYLFLLGIPVQNIRYFLAVYPPVVTSIGIGGVTVLRWLFHIRSHAFRYAAGTLLLLAYLWGSYDTWRTAQGLLNGFIGNKNRELATVEWVAAQIPETGATVYGLDLNLTMAHYTALKPVQVYYETPVTLAARLPKDAPSYALFNVPATETQWKGKAPGQVYHWLLDGPGLEEIGRYGDYTLFRVLSRYESKE